MASGKPDWNRIVTIQGKDGDDFRPILVDGAGQMYIALTGQRIDVGQEDSDRIIVGKDGEELHYIAVDGDGVILSRMQGKYDAVTQKDVKVDVNGNMISLMKGADGEELTTLFVDDEGKMVARIQGVTGGDLVVYVLDDCGDSDNVSNWAGAIDALDPVESTTFVREGSKSMELGIDASLNGLDYATWVNQQTKGDLTGVNNDKVKIWIWISTIDYLLAAGTALKYGIGSGIGDFYYFNFTKAQLNIGWNELECDLSSPDGSTGTPDWSAIDVQFFDVYEIVANTDDFYIVVDSIVIVRDNPAPGTLKDLNTDANGFLLAKMVASFGDYLKPLACDRYGNVRVNPTQTDKKPLIIGDYTQTPIPLAVFRNHPAIETYQLCNIPGPGMILSLLTYHYANVGHTGCFISLIIDGVTIQNKTYATLNAYKMTTDNTAMMPLVNYDTTNNRYMNSTRKWLYFKESLRITIDEVVGTAGNTRLEMNYVLF